MRALVPVAIVAIIAVTVLLLVWTDRRRKVRREILHEIQNRAAFAEKAIAEIRNEARLQEQAGVTDLNQIQIIIHEYDANARNLALPTITTTRKRTQ